MQGSTIGDINIAIAVSYIGPTLFNPTCKSPIHRPATDVISGLRHSLWDGVRTERSKRRRIVIWRGIIHYISAVATGGYIGPTLIQHVATHSFVSRRSAGAT